MGGGANRLFLVVLDIFLLPLFLTLVLRFRGGVFVHERRNAIVIRASIFVSAQ